MKRSLALLLAAVLALGAPAQSAANAVAKAAPAIPAVRLAGLSKGQRMLVSMPGLSIESHQTPGLVAGALEAVLLRHGSSPDALAALPEAERARAVEAALRADASAAAEAAEAEPAADRALEVRSAHASLLRVRSLDLAARSISKGALSSALELHELESSARKRFEEASEALLEGTLQKIELAGAEWNGRTVDVALEDGSVLSVKFHTDRDAARTEAERTQEAAELGLAAPISLVHEPRYVRLPDDAPKHLRPEKRIKARLPVYDLAWAYLVPAPAAKQYRSYVNDRIPAPKARRVELLQATADTTVDQLLALARAGKSHRSLMPLTHHGANWEWDYWRWSLPMLGGLRFGPSFISGWRKAFKYPNVRLSGLADFEHVESVEGLRATHDHPDHGLVRHDAYSLGFGQTLTELGFLLMHAGVVNGLSSRQTARLIWSAQRRYVEALSPRAAAELPERSVLAALESSTRRFRFVRVVAAPVAIVLVSAGVLAANVTVGSAFGGALLWNLPLLNFVLFHYLNKGGFLGSWGNMPGWATHPLIIRAVKPAVEALRADAVSVGVEAEAGHPAGDRWSRDMRKLFAAILPASIVLPAAIVAFSLLLLDYGARTVGLAMPMVPIMHLLAVGALAMPARLLAGYVGGAARRP